MVKTSRYMVVREEKYAALLSKFACLWEITELNQGGVVMTMGSKDHLVTGKLM